MHPGASRGVGGFLCRHRSAVCLYSRADGTTPLEGLPSSETWEGRPFSSARYQGQLTTSTVRVTGVALLPPLSVSEYVTVYVPTAQPFTLPERHTWADRSP